MKRLLLLTTLAVVASGATAAAAFASGAFGLFYCPTYCDKRCGAFAIHKNAFTQVPNCCPGPCAFPGCNPAVPPALGPCGFHGPQSFGCGGFSVRAPFGKVWTRCRGGDCSVGGCDGYAGHDGFVDGDLGPIGPGFHASAAPLGGYSGAPVWGGNFYAGQFPASFGSPIPYPSYGMAPALPTWGGYGYGAYPVAAPSYSPAPLQSSVPATK